MWTLILYIAYLTYRVSIIQKYKNWSRDVSNKIWKDVAIGKYMHGLPKDICALNLDLRNWIFPKNKWWKLISTIM